MENRAENRPKSATATNSKSPLPAILRLLVGLGIIAFIIWRVDYTKLIETLVRVNPLWLLSAFTVQMSSFIVWGWRWEIVSHIFDIQIPLWRLIRGLFVGGFFNNFLPTIVGGDLYRAYWVLDDKRLYRKSLFIIFIERFTGLITLGYVALPFLFWLLIQKISFDDFLIPFLLLLIALCGGIVILHPAVFSFFNRLIFRNSRFLAAPRQQVEQALTTLHHSGRRKWGIYFFSVLVQIHGIIYYYCIGQSLNLALDLWHYFVIVPIVVFITMFPITFNGLGVREGVLVLLTGLLGVAVHPGEAVALGLTAMTVNILISLIGGFFYIRGNTEKPTAEDYAAGANYAAIANHAAVANHIAADESAPETP